MTDLEIAIGSELSNASYLTIQEQKESVAKNMEAIYLNSIEGIEDTLNPSQINETIQELYLTLHPIGDIIINATGENPGDVYGGVWEVFGPGRTLMGVDYTRAEYKKANLQGGKKFHTHKHGVSKHTHTVIPHAHTINHSHKIGNHTHVLNPHIHAMEHSHTFEHTHEFYHSHLQSIGWSNETQYYISLIGNKELTETPIESACYWKASKTFEIGSSIPRAFTSWKTVLFQPIPNLYLGKATSIFTGEAQAPYRASKEETKDTHTLYSSLTQVELKEMKNNIEDRNPKTTTAYMSTLQPYIVCYMFRRIA